MNTDIRIVKAAVTHQGRTYVGMRHEDIKSDIRCQFPGEQISQENEGFLTSDGRFLNRYQAGAVAYRAGQTKTRKQYLLSEDLW